MEKTHGMIVVELKQQGWQLDRTEYSFAFNADIEFWSHPVTGEKKMLFVR